MWMTWITTKIPAWIAIIVVPLVVLLAISILSRISVAGTSRGGIAGGATSREVAEKTGRLVHAASRWLSTAKQDKEPLLALMHISYAKADAMMVRELMHEAEVVRLLKTDIKALLKSIEKEERTILARISHKAPSLVPDNLDTGGWVP